jgi:hypothetical protein
LRSFVRRSIGLVEQADDFVVKEEQIQLRSGGGRCASRRINAVCCSGHGTTDCAHSNPRRRVRSEYQGSGGEERGMKPYAQRRTDVDREPQIGVGSLT